MRDLTLAKLLPRFRDACVEFGKMRNRATYIDNASAAFDIDELTVAGHKRAREEHGLEDDGHYAIAQMARRAHVGAQGAQGAQAPRRQEGKRGEGCHCRKNAKKELCSKPV